MTWNSPTLVLLGRARCLTRLQVESNKFVAFYLCDLSPEAASRYATIFEYSRCEQVGHIPHFLPVATKVSPLLAILAEGP